MGGGQSTPPRSKNGRDSVQDVLDHQKAAYEEKRRQILMQKQRVSKAHEAVERIQATSRNTYSQLYPDLGTSESVQPIISKASYYDSPNTSNLQRSTKPSINQLPTSGRYAVTPSAPSSLSPGASTSQSNSSQPNTSKYSTRPPTTVRSAATPSAPPPSEPATSTNYSSNSNTPTTSKYSSRRKDDESNLWKCITCKNGLGVKIFQCKLGHSSCMVCKFKGLYCGVCKNSITDTRNIDLEHYIEEVQSKTINDPERVVDCPNKNDGCRLSFKQGNMEAHLQECLFREMHCPLAFLYDGCFWRGKINHIKEHILDCHPNQAGADVDTEMTLYFNVGNNTVHHVVMGNFHFLVHLKLDSQALYSTAQLIGSRISASKWTYELHIYNKSEPRRKYTYTDICNPNSDLFADICEVSTCAILPWPYITSFVNNNALTYKFYIKKVQHKTEDSRPQRRYGKPFRNNNKRNDA